MDAELAAGPKTESTALVGFSDRMQRAIEDQIVALSGGMTECLDTARTTAFKDDPHGHRRSNERTDAMKLTQATAELLQALGKLKGGFQYDYRVTRTDTAPSRPRLKLGWSGEVAELLTQAEYDALDEWDKSDYNRWTEGLPPEFGGWKRPARLAHTTDTPLPPENRGSNKDAAKP